VSDVHVCSLSSSAPGESEACWPNVSLRAGVEQSSTMPRPPPRTSRHHRRSSDLSATQYDDLSKNSNEQTPVKAVVDRLESAFSSHDGRSLESERSLKGPAGLGPAAASPSSTGVLAPTNTRRIGNKFCIDLVKGWLTPTSDN